MRYGIISDIHANLEALEAVLKALSKEKVNRYVCVGDIVGYGAEPTQCIKEVMELNMTSVLGNHDSGCIGKTDLMYFNNHAKEALLWTKDNLLPSDSDYLTTLELVSYDNNFTLTHGTLDEPKVFNYMLDAYTAKKSFDLMSTQILFVGHSHVPGIFEYKDENIKYFYKEKIKLSKDARYIINTGSVGQPRDGDNRAVYAVYNYEEKEIYLKRVEYNIKKAQDKIIKAGLPSMLAYRLSQGL